MRLQTDFTSDLGASCTGYERIQPMRKAAFGLVRKTLEQHRCGNQPQYPVAQKLKPLVVRFSRAAMGQCLLKQFQISGCGSDNFFEPV